MVENTLLYEQPLNELIRVCLRLEKLFFQIDHLLPDQTSEGTHNLVGVIINILHILDRPDLKAKLAKELSQQISLLQRLKETPELDREKLDALLKELEELSRVFIESSGKIGQNLREIELFNNLRLHLATPGGGCSFDIPLYYYWLKQPIDERKKLIQEWLNEFRLIRRAVMLLLQLLREESKVLEKQAENGFYQELLDPQINVRLIRVAVPKDLQAYPEISVGRHFISIRFYTPKIEGRPTQYPDNLKFWMSQCIS